MNPNQAVVPVVVWLPIAITAGINICCCVFVYGRLTERSKSHEDRLNGIDLDIDRHNGQISENSTRIAKVEGAMGMNGRGSTHSASAGR